jgi:transcriptional regulator with XRE-family HTH domain
MKQARVGQQYMAVSELLRELRVAAGLRQEHIAAILHVPQSFVSKYESGERRLDIMEVRGLCKVFGITLQEFAGLLEKKLEAFLP